MTPVIATRKKRDFDPKRLVPPSRESPERLAGTP
jgi:hypothetical protein